MVWFHTTNLGKIQHMAHFHFCSSAKRLKCLSINCYINPTLIHWNASQPTCMAWLKIEYVLKNSCYFNDIQLSLLDTQYLEGIKTTYAWTHGIVCIKISIPAVVPSDGRCISQLMVSTSIFFLLSTPICKSTPDLTDSKCISWGHPAGVWWDSGLN